MRLHCMLASYILWYLYPPFRMCGEASYLTRSSDFCPGCPNNSPTASDRMFSRLPACKPWLSANIKGEILVKFFPVLFLDRQNKTGKQKRFPIYSETCLERPLSWKTSCLETTHLRQKDPYFNITKPLTKDHLSWQTAFLWPMGWYFQDRFYCTSIYCCQCALHDLSTMYDFGRRHWCQSTAT